MAKTEFTPKTEKLTPLEQFKEDCHIILKKLDCWGDEKEVMLFVVALETYERAKTKEPHRSRSFFYKKRTLSSEMNKGEPKQ